MRIKTAILFIFWLMTQNAMSFDLMVKVTRNQKDSSVVFKNRKKACLFLGLGGTVITHAGLYQLWYKGYPSSRFHFFNDNREWLQLDKFGHAFSAYYLGLAGIEAAKWAGVPKEKRWKWALFGSIFQDPIEIWDGLSSQWGASAGDLAANTLGTVLSAGQEYLWHEQKFKLKFSYTASPYAIMRPNTLGSNLPERILKDYNAQTYWLCFSPMPRKRLGFIGLAFGYGADGMLGGEYNIWTDSKNVVYDRRDIERKRQYYLALDIDFTRIPTKNPHVSTLLFALNCIKIPSPALEFSGGKLRGHALKF